MGGRVALEIVRRSEGRVTGIALLNTGVHPPAAHETASRGRLVSLARSAGMTALAAEWLPPMLNQTGPVQADVQARLVAMVERGSPDSFAAQIRALLTRTDAAPVLARLRIPTLLLSATGDTWSPPAQHEAMRELCPRAELIIVPEAGHMLPIEQPARWPLPWTVGWRVLVGPVRRHAAMRCGDADIVRACTQQIITMRNSTTPAHCRIVPDVYRRRGLRAAVGSDNPVHGRAAIRASFERVRRAGLCMLSST